MANAPIGFPRLYQTLLPWVQQTRAQPDGANAFVAGQFVRMASGALIAYAADDVSVYGLALDASHASTDEPYLTPFGENHNLVSPRGAVFVMNITDASGTVGSGTTTQGAVTVGALYSAGYLASPYGTILGIDASDSGTATKNIFKVVGLYNTAVDPLGDASGDFNGRVLVQFIESGIQS